MNILIYADAHFSLNSSILLGSTNSLVGRLEHLIKSFEWMYSIARNKKVDLIVDLGDLADSYNLRAEEITAISKALNYNTTRIPEYHLLGNHERMSEDGTINSVNFVDSIENSKLITEIVQDSDITYIPYGYYEDGDFDKLSKTKIAFSHIDIYGADLGTGWSLKSGLSPSYLNKRFDFVINGHIHSYSYVVDKPKKKILNLGAISGQNFSSKGTPHIAILNTDTLEIEFIDNPYALNFINKTCNTVTDLVSLVDSLKENTSYAVQVKVPMELVEDARNILDDNKVMTSRIRVIPNKNNQVAAQEEIDKVSSVDGGFNKLREYLDLQEKLPYDKKLILSVIKELEENKL